MTYPFPGHFRKVYRIYKECDQWNYYWKLDHRLGSGEYLSFQIFATPCRPGELLHTVCTDCGCLYRLPPGGRWEYSHSAGQRDSPRRLPVAEEKLGYTGSAETLQQAEDWLELSTAPGDLIRLLRDVSRWCS